MPHTLYARLSIALVFLLVLVGFIYVLISTISARNYIQEVDQQLNRELSRNLVADRNLVQEGRLNEMALKETFMKYMVINPSIEIYLLDREGLILSYSAEPGKVKRNRVAMQPIYDFLSGKKDYPLLGDDPRSHDRRKAFSVTPVPSAENLDGYLYVVLRGEEYDQIEDIIWGNYFLRISAWSIGVSLVLSLLAGLFLFRLLTRRLNTLSASMGNFLGSHFNHFEYYPARVNKQGQGDEIDQLGHNFNQMARRIEVQIDELKGQDKLRRELVQNVSHDLRTPLAILHGYLETLQLKDLEIDKETRAHYLSLALHSSKQLGQLIAELFELAKLDAHETLPHFESFPIAELAQDVVAKFRLKAGDKALQLQVEAQKNMPFVYADIAMIERVLENLVANAIRHTPHQGTVDLYIQQLGDKIELKLTDSGSGIADEECAFIFDRFYQSKQSDADGGSGHSGLGLAISKRILELHGSDIRVSSQLGAGTTFIFCLSVQSTIE